MFLNWSLMTQGAWDYPADARGYTWGAALEYITPDWALRAGRFMQPKDILAPSQPGTLQVLHF